MRSRRTFLALSLLALGACGDDSTGRARVRFPVTARGVDTTAFTTSRGWSVTVTEARVAVGPLRWYEGPPIFALRWWERALGVSVAHAHPGHYVPGESLADVLTRRVVDLTGAPTVFDMADGVTGAAQSAHLELRPPSSDLGTSADALSGATLMVRGTATMGASSVRFVGRQQLSINLEGISASGAVDTAGWELRVSVGQWVDRVDFAALAPATPGAEVEFGADSQAANALYRGATSVGSYRFVKTSATADAGR